MDKVLQYAHYGKNLKKAKRQPFTVAAEIDFSSDLLYGALRHNKSVIINLGQTKLHPDDRHFVKKIGRSEAAKDLKMRGFLIIGVEVFEKYNLFTLYNPEMDLSIYLSVRPDRVHPLLVGAY